jgi:hypothetical protein
MMTARKLWIIGIGCVLFLALCGLLAKPAYQLFKEYRSSHLAETALNAYIEAPSDMEVVRVAYERAKSALFLHPKGFEANRVLAIITQFQQPKVSLQYWDQAFEVAHDVENISFSDKMGYVQALIINGQFDKARQFLETLQGDEKQQAEIDYNLAKVCYMSKDLEAALEFGRKMVRSRFTPLSRHVFYASMCLSSDSASHIAEGERHIKILIENNDLITDSMLWEMAQIPGLSAEIDRKLQTALDKRISDFDEAMAFASYSVRSGQRSVTEAYEKLLSGINPADDSQRAKLAKWCQTYQLWDEMDRWIDLPLSLKRKDWFLTYMKLLGHQKKWSKIREVLETEDCPIEVFWKHILLSDAYYELGEKAKATNAWFRAKIESQPIPLHLWILVRTGDKMVMTQEVTALLDELILVGVPPEQVIAYIAGRDFAVQNYEGFYLELESFREKYPANPEILNDWIYYSFLLERNELEAWQEINDLVAQYPKRLRYHMTWALGKIREKAYRDVLARFQQFDVDWETLHPKWRFILAIALAGAGEVEQGKHYLAGIKTEEMNQYELELYERHFY